jgi:peptidoglycan hydrolase-like protein with peptidoglycan-binding domain
MQHECSRGRPIPARRIAVVVATAGLLALLVPFPQQHDSGTGAAIGLGRPAFAASGRALVREVQGLLAERGYDPGPVDGLMGRGTRNAILRYQREHSLPADGRASAKLRDHLRSAPAVTRAEGRDDARAGAGPSSARSDPALALRDTELRSSPSVSAPVVTRVSAGGSVTLIGTSGRWSLARTSRGAEGWAPAAHFRIGLAEQQSPQSNAGKSWLRSLTALLSPRRPQRAQGGTVTVGIRGLQADDIANARPNPGAVEGLGRYRASEDTARRHARRSGLVARRFDYLVPKTQIEGAEPTSMEDSN